MAPLGSTILHFIPYFIVKKYDINPFPPAISSTKPFLIFSKPNFSTKKFANSEFLKLLLYLSSTFKGSPSCALS